MKGIQIRHSNGIPCNQRKFHCPFRKGRNEKKKERILPNTFSTENERRKKKLYKISRDPLSRWKETSGITIPFNRSKNSPIRRMTLPGVYSANPVSIKPRRNTAFAKKKKISGQKKTAGKNRIHRKTI